MCTFSKTYNLQKYSLAKISFFNRVLCALNVRRESGGSAWRRHNSLVEPALVNACGGFVVCQGLFGLEKDSA